MKPSCLVRALALALGVVAGDTAFGQSSAPAPAGAASAPPAQECSKLVYPEQAIRAGAQGVTIVAFHLDATGKITSAEVVHSAGRTREHRLLDQATVRGLSACKFEAPKDADGHPVAGVVNVPYRWLLD
jgi:protein TonB